MPDFRKQGILHKTYRPTMTARKCRCTKGLRHGRSLRKTYHRPTIDLP